MLNRNLSYLIKDQNPVMLSLNDSVQHACHEMREHHIGAVLVIDDKKELVGIFTKRDALGLIEDGKNMQETHLADVMTPHPDTITPNCTVIDALRTMDDCGFRHLPIVDEQRGVLGIVSYADFKGEELRLLEKEKHLWECI